MRKILSVAIAVASMIGGASAQAGTATANIAVNVTVQTNCIFTGGAVAATYVPGTGAGNGNNPTALTVACSPDAVTPTVSFGAGSTAGGTIAQRLASAGAAPYLQYNLYTAASGGQILGNGTTGVTVPVAGSTIAAPKAVPVYLIVPDNANNQGLAGGLYQDTVLATLTF